MSREILTLKKIKKCYQQGSKTLHILNGLDLGLRPGEIVGLVGVSGSGKSTLLHVAGLLDSPTSGEIILDGSAVSHRDEGGLTKWRNEKIGFVYQFHHLLPEFSALENVMLPHLMQGHSPKKAFLKAEILLERLGLQNRMHHYPSTLSGGEQQRVAVARALVNDPAVILADEPTGNLDPETAKMVFNLFLSIAKERELSCLIATHDRALAKKMDRMVCLENGLLREKFS